MVKKLISLEEIGLASNIIDLLNTQLIRDAHELCEYYLRDLPKGTIKHVKAALKAYDFAKSHNLSTEALKELRVGTWRSSFDSKRQFSETVGIMLIFPTNCSRVKYIVEEYQLFTLGALAEKNYEQMVAAYKSGKGVATNVTEYLKVLNLV